MCSSGASVAVSGSSWTMVLLTGATGSAAAVTAATVAAVVRRRRLGRALCSSSSRSALANKVSATPVMTMARPGHMTSWGSRYRLVKPSLSMFPQVGMVWSPKPRKSRPTWTAMAMPKTIEACKMIGARTTVRMCRAMILKSLTPETRAASTNSSLRTPDTAA